MATPNLKPNADNEGQIGIIGRLWQWVRAVNVYVTGNITNGTDSVTITELRNTIDSSTKNELTNVITPPTLTATANNYNPTGFESCDLIRQDVDTNNRQITGLKAPSPAKYVIKRINNLSSSNDIRFVNESGGSDAENRILLRDGATKSIKPNETAVFYYDVIQQRYKPLTRVG